MWRLIKGGIIAVIIVFIFKNPIAAATKGVSFVDAAGIFLSGSWDAFTRFVENL